MKIEDLITVDGQPALLKLLLRDQNDNTLYVKQWDGYVHAIKPMYKLIGDEVHTAIWTSISQTYRWEEL